MVGSSNITCDTGIQPSCGYLIALKVLPKCTLQPWSEDNEIAGYQTLVVSTSVNATPNGKPFW